MKPRIVTSLIGLPIILSFLFSFLFLKILILLLMILSSYEIFQMSNLKKQKYLIISIFLVNSLFLLSVGFDALFTTYFIGVFSLLAVFLLIFLIFTNWRFRNSVFENSSRNNTFYIFLISILYFSLILIHIVFLRAEDQGFRFLIFVLGVTFSVDTFSYFIGSLIGKRRDNFLSLISPNKTIEGTLGGLLIGCLFSIFLSRILDINGPWYSLLIVSLLVPFFAIIGDFLQSGLKRYFGVKDSGGSLPGHGGFLDRIDSLGLSAFSYYWILVFI
ncbi:MAG: hypothetical protein CL764_05925 [Chloroflexi bacterium]|nr:hypothetical protein [Chloroflexota bacterium]